MTINHRKAYSYALMTVFLWSTVATAFKFSLYYLSPIGLLFYACVSSILLLTSVLIIKKQLHLLWQCSARQYLHSFLFGLLNPFLYYLILFKAYDLLPAQEAQPLNYTWALTLSFLAVFILKQRLSRYDIAASLISYTGVLIISTHGDIVGLEFSNGLGVSLALLSTVVWALYWIYSSLDDRPPLVGVCLNFIFSLPCIALVASWQDALIIPPLQGLLGALYVGFFEMGIAFVLWLNALKYAESTSQISNLIFISPFLSLVFIYFLLGEQIYPSTFIGLIFIVVGLGVQQWGRQRAPVCKNNA